MNLLTLVMLYTHCVNMNIKQVKRRIAIRRCRRKLKKKVDEVRILRYSKYTRGGDVPGSTPSL